MKPLRFAKIGDLLYIARESRELFNHNPLMAKLTTKVIAEIKTKPEIYRVFYEKLVVPRIQQFRQIVERAQKRGELRPDLDATFILYLIFSALVYGNIFTELIDPDAQQVYEPEAAVDVLLRGIGTAWEHRWRVWRGRSPAAPCCNVLPNLRQACEPEQLTWTQSPILRGLTSLPVTF